MAVPRLDYDVLDVFTDRPFAGNQLAVVHGAGGLASEQCLALAREFGYSETTFPVPTGETSYDVRIFTPGGEVPFAGHPTLGTAYALRSRGLLSGDSLVQRCGAGDVAVAVLGEQTLGLSAPPRDLVGPLPEDLVAAVLADLGLGPDDRDGDAWLAGTGLTFLHVPVRAYAVTTARPSTVPLAERLAPWADLLDGVRDPVEGVDLHSLVVGGADEVEVHARVFVPGLSVPEDAATGSSATGLGMVLVADGRLHDGGSYVVSQGLEMGRPSRLLGRVETAPTPEGDRAVLLHVAGGVRAVARGQVVEPARG